MLLVAATDRGICSLLIGNDAANLEALLRSEFPNAEIVGDNAELSDWIDTIVRHISGQEKDIDLPLDIRATAFQRQVWEELQKIPYGSVRTYSEIARAIGKPKAARAVASACASNPAAVIIPCHRVVRKDGSLGGYSWGIDRKAALLEQERQHSPRD